MTHRLNVKTHVFKKELQEYVPTQIEDRLRIETIIYVELSIVDQNNALVNAYDYARLPKDLFFSQPDKVMSPEEMATKRIIDISATLQCPSNNWQEEKEACLRCARRMSTKLDQTETRIMHMLPELHRTDNGDALISFRSGVANIQFKINCYCGHKKEKEGFVIRFDSQSDVSIASHVTLPLMFYHQNKNRVASRALAAAAKAQAKPDQQQQQQPLEQESSARNVVKSVTSKTKRESRSKPGSSPIGNQHQIPSPPNSLLGSPVEWSSSPEIDDFIDSSDIPFTVPSPPPPDPLISLFPESAVQEQHQQQQLTIALITHMTPNSGPVRGGTLVTIHGSGFTVGEVMYVCFGENMIPIIPQRDHMLECITPASNKAETVPVFAMNAESNVAQATFTYVDDNEKELIKLALQRMMNISARMEGPLDNVLSRANEFALWTDLLDGGVDGSSTPSSLFGNKSYTSLERMVLDSFEILDTPTAKNVDGLSIANSTGHTMLHLAVWLDYETLAKDLLVRNVDAVIQDKNGLTALDWARRLNNESMIALLANDVPTSISTLVGGKLALTAEHDEVAHGLQSSVSPGSRPTATDQFNMDSSHSGIAAQAFSPPPSQPARKNIALDLNVHMDPHMDVQLEGFGQGPGNDVATQGRVMDGFFDKQHSENIFVQQARENVPGLAHGESASTLSGAQCLAVHHQQEQDRPQYQKTWSAIPTGSADEPTEFAPVQDGHSPIPLSRLPIGSVPRVGMAGAIEDVTKQNIPIQNLAFAAYPTDRSLDPLRHSVGALDRIAPIGQDTVAIEGSTSTELKSAGQISRRVQSHGSIQSIQGTARIDDSTREVQAPTTIVVDALGQQYQQDQQHVNEAVSEDSPSDREDAFVVGVRNSVANVHGNVVVDEADNAKQAVVQSSRNDVESEPLLFLGGLPVTLARSSHMDPTAMSSSTARSRSEQQPQKGSPGAEEDMDDTYI
ncbi:SPT3 Dosage dependent suppressor of Ty-induced promoter mutations-like protein [Mortierella sp. NVP85]|nr:SPT3 Dosage dependent suppressor of Ty-induced promoter mutations-like protein [Mortierella sp. NVP85]